MSTQLNSRRLARRRNSIQIVAVASSVLAGALFSALPASAAPSALAAASVAPPQPVGPSGSWSSVFHDEFNGTAVDTSHWMTHWYVEGGQQNKAATYSRNVAETGGNLVLTLAGPNSGASVSSDVPGGHKVAVGEYVEASVMFPGSGTSIHNWPAWWISGPNWPSAGEHDIAEGLGTQTVNYHSPSGNHSQGTIPGVWSNAFHTYGIYRAANHADVYWDGQLVKSYRTDDNGQPENMIFNIGNGNTSVYGAGSQVRVDWVRAWTPGPGATPTVPVAVAPPSQASWWGTYWNDLVAWFQSQISVLFG